MKHTENSLHEVMSIAFREDKIRLRRGYATENINVLIYMEMNILKVENTLKKYTGDKIYLILF